MSKMREWKCDDLGCEYEVTESGGCVLLSLDDREVVKWTFHRKVKLSVMLCNPQSTLLTQDKETNILKQEIQDLILNSEQSSFSVYKDPNLPNGLSVENNLCNIIKTESWDSLLTPYSNSTSKVIQKSVSNTDHISNYSASTDSTLTAKTQSIVAKHSQGPCSASKVSQKSIFNTDHKSSNNAQPAFNLTAKTQSIVANNSQGPRITAQTLQHKKSSAKSASRSTAYSVSPRYVHQSSNIIKVGSLKNEKTSHSPKYLPSNSLPSACAARQRIDQRRKDLERGMYIFSKQAKFLTTNSSSTQRNGQRLHNEARPEFYCAKRDPEMLPGANISKSSRSNYMSEMMSGNQPLKTASLTREEIKCEVCGQKFSTRREFIYHIRNKKIIGKAKKHYVCEPCKEKKGTVFGKFGFEAHFIVHNQVYHSSQTGKEILRSEADIEKKVQCPFCNYHTLYIENLKMHVRKHTQESPYQCCVCKDFVFKWDRHVKAHERSTSSASSNSSTCRTKLLRFRCSRCDVRFHTNRELRDHMQTHPNICRYCKTTFHTQSALNKHIQVAHQNDALKCSICSKLFNEKLTYNNHMRNHRFRKKQSCPVCGLIVVRLKVHMKVHTEKPDAFACDLCPRKFRTVARLNFHHTLHSGEKQYQCDFCPSRFRLAGTLRNHMKIHNEERDYVCEVCGKTARTAYNLKIHKRIHSDQRPFPCTMCEQAFNYKASLKGHMKSRHRVDLDALLKPEQINSICVTREKEENK